MERFVLLIAAIASVAMGALIITGCVVGVYFLVNLIA